MIVDASTASRSGFERRFDVCVIGAGPAGITLARRLAGRGWSVALMEGGGMAASAKSQNLYDGENVGLPYYTLGSTRLRLFGGSSNHWGGRCAEFEALSFAPPGRPFAAWPITKSDLDPYAPDADKILELPPTMEPRPAADGSDRFRRLLFRQSPPTVFGERYGDEIAASRQIHCGLNANLVDLRLDAAGAVDAACFRGFDPGDPGFVVRARVFCLCLGGLENPRFLLNCASQRPSGIGNEHDLVGRYFAEHLHLRLGMLYYAQPLDDPDAPEEGRNSYVPTRAFLESRQALSFSIHVYPVVEAELRLAKELARSAACLSPAAGSLLERLAKTEVDCDRQGLRHYLTQRGRPLALSANVRVRTEQSLVRDSRVMLGDDRDAMGQRRIRLDWRAGEIDYATVRTAAIEFGAHFAERDEGRLRIEDWILDDPMVLPVIEDAHGVGGHHHMCTTRMSRDPREGVVDADCRVHSVANLYLGGSSVFASPGYANPTYTIVQLALRLGDHLSGVLSA